MEKREREIVGAFLSAVILSAQACAATLSGQTCRVGDLKQEDPACGKLPSEPPPQEEPR